MTRTPRLPMGAVVVAAVLVLLTAACGGGESSAPEPLREQVRVEGKFGARPAITVNRPLQVKESTSWVAHAGDGDPVVQGATAILELTLADGRTGKTVISTGDRGQRPLEVSLNDQVFPSLVEALTGKHAGSRVVVASTGEDAYGRQGAPQLGIKPGDPVVMVADVLSTDPTSVLDGPDGDEVAQKADVPTVVQRSDGTPTGFSVRHDRKPGGASVHVLRKGDGPKIEPPARVTVNYLGAVWGKRKAFDESYSKEPMSISVGMGQVIKCWDNGLAGATEGSRLLLVCPPKLGYGKTAQPGIPAGSTLVFVVDVLGVG